MSQEDYTKFWQAAYEYNKELATKPMNFTLSDEELTEYNKILDPTGTGMKRYSNIPLSTDNDLANVEIPEDFEDMTGESDELVSDELVEIEE